MYFPKIAKTTLVCTNFIIMTYMLSTEFSLEGILFQWDRHSDMDFTSFSPIMESIYGTTMSKQQMIDVGVFMTNTNSKKLQADALDKIKNWYKVYVSNICTSNSNDCIAKMKIVPYQHVSQSDFCINITNNTNLTHAYTNYMKPNKKSYIVNNTDNFVINLDLNVLYPPLDRSVDSFNFTKRSTTFPVRPAPVSPAHVAPENPPVNAASQTL